MSIKAIGAGVLVCTDCATQLWDNLKVGDARVTLYQAATGELWAETNGDPVTGPDLRGLCESEGMGADYLVHCFGN